MNPQEFASITRRAFVPKMVANIYNSSPLAARLMANAKAHSPERVKEKPMNAPLHLTAENREEIRRTVLLIWPRYIEELQEKIAAKEAQAAEEQAALAAQMRQFQQAASQQAASANTFTPGPWITTVASGTANVPYYGNTTAQQIYNPVGTGFTTYGPLLPDQGLTISKP